MLQILTEQSEGLLPLWPDRGSSQGQRGSNNNDNKLLFIYLQLVAAIVLKKTNKYQLFTIQSSSLNINVIYSLIYIHIISSADAATASVSFPVLNHIFELLCVSSGFYCVR